MLNCYNQYKPGFELDDYVECFWIWKSDAPEQAFPQRLVPGGRIELMFNLADPLRWMLGEDAGTGFNQSAILMGQRDKIFYVQQKGRAEIAGIRFKPGGLSAFSKSSAKEFLNLVLPAEFAFGKEVHVWLSKIGDAKSDASRILLLEQFLVSTFKSESRHWKFVNPAVEYIRNSPGQISIAALCEDQNTYYKKLERSFLECVGYTPKSYNRIVRFNQALRLMYKSKKSLTEIGYDCDYFDQSHFIKDFHLFTGTSPSQFTRESNYVAEFLLRNQSV